MRARARSRPVSNWRSKAQFAERPRRCCAMAAPTEARQVHGIDKDLVRGQELKMEMDSTSVKEALLWLEKLTNEPVSDMDLWEALRTGVVLCKAVNALRPDRPLVEKIQTRPLALLERGNIEEYLKACTKLGLPSSDTFHISDLYEKKYLPGVLQNILALAKLAEARNMLPENAPKMRRHRRAASSGRVLWADQEAPNPSLSAQAVLTSGEAPGQQTRVASSFAQATAPAASTALPVVTLSTDEIALREVMTEAGAIANFSQYEMETDLAQLKTLGVTSLSTLRRFMLNRDIWIAAKLPMLTKVALERTIAKRNPPRGIVFRLFVASLTGGAMVFAAYKLRPFLEGRFPALASVYQHMQHLQQVLSNLSLPKLPKIRLVVESSK